MIFNSRQPGLCRENVGCGNYAIVSRGIGVISRHIVAGSSRFAKLPECLPIAAKSNKKRGEA